MPIRDYRPTTQAPGPAGSPEISLAIAGDSSGAQQLGQSIADVGTMLEQARQETQMNDARLAMTEGLGRLNLDLSEDQDFGTMKARYDQRLKDLQSDVLGRLDTPRLKSAMQLEYARGRIGAEAQLIRRQQDLEGSHARATLSQQLRSSGSAIVNADSPEAGAESYRVAGASIDSLVKAGHMTAEEGETARARLDGEISTGLVLRDINKDAASAAKALEAPGAYGLEEVDRQRYLSTARRAAESEARAGRSILEQKVAGARGVLVRGGAVAPEDLEALRVEVKGTDQEALLEGSIAASEQLGKFAAATPSERAAYLAEARERGIRVDDVSIGNAQIATLEAVDAEIARSETAELKDLGERVKGAVIALGDGRVVADIDAVRAAVEGTPFAGELRIAEARKDFVDRYKTLPKDGQAALLKQARETGVLAEQRTVDEAFLDALEAIDSAATTAIKKDPIQYGIDNQVPGAAPLDLGDKAAVLARMALVKEMTEHYGATPFIFSEAERKAFKKSANEGTPEEQLALVVSVIDGFGPGAEAAFAEIDGLDPVVRRAGDLVFETGDDEVAGIILAGRKSMEIGDELRVPTEDALAVFEKSIDGVLQSMPGRREEIIEAAKAYYAFMAPGRVTLDKVDAQSKLLLEGVQRVMGAMKINGTVYGGIQEVNGKRVKLPTAFDASAVERLFSGADLATWKAGSLSGNAPVVDETETLPDQKPVLQWIKGSIYRVGVKARRGPIEWYQDSAVSNGYFYVDLEKMAGDFLKNPPKNPRPTKPYLPLID